VRSHLTSPAKARAAAALAAVTVALSVIAGFAASSGGAPVDQQSDVQAVSFGNTSSPSLYWGAWIGDQLNGTKPPYDMSAVEQFEAMVGKGLSILEWSLPFARCADFTRCPPYSFPAAEMNRVRGHGAIPMLSWSSDAGGGVNQPDFQLSDVISGRYDSLIRSFASGAKSWGHPFFLRFNWEMNGNWFAWSERANGNRPGEFVAAWRHVHDIFTQVGATNATWVWCPYADLGYGFTYDDSLYPGDSYVDWTCVDAYNWGAGPKVDSPWRSFDEPFRANYLRITRDLAPGKPMMIGEFASSDYGGNKAAWIRNTLARLAKLPSAYPKIYAFVWFDVDDRSSHWPIEDSPASIKAFRAGIGSDAFVPNQDRFKQIESRPIQPLPPRQSDYNLDAGD